jgi:5'-3' exonuclease
MEKPETVMLVDGNNILMRSIYAGLHTGMGTSDGSFSTGPLTVFIGMLSSYIREWKPTSVVVCWDHGPSTRRRKLYPDYKLARREAPDADGADTHFGLAKKFLSLCEIQQVAVAGYEADDVVAAYWSLLRRDTQWDWTEDELTKIIIVSGDKDFFQLLDTAVVQIRPETGGYTLWDTERVREKLGCDPLHLPSLMALQGDPGDGIPGVPGIGPKRALKGLKEAGWDLMRVKALQDPQNYAAAIQSYALVNLRETSWHPLVPPVRPFEPVYVGAEGGGNLLVFISSLEMTGVGNRLVNRTLWT